MRRVAESGHEVGLHGFHHYRVSRQTPQQFRDEILRGRKAVAAASGQDILGYRAPMFSINRSALWALEILREEGFRYDSSVFPTRNMLYGYPDAPRFPYCPLDGNGFVEFPLSTVRVLGVNLPVAGGFYLRALPYRLTRAARINHGGALTLRYTLENLGDVRVRQAAEAYLAGSVKDSGNSCAAHDHGHECHGH